MEILELHKELEAFVEAIDSFPASETKSQFYNIEKLLSIREYDILKDFFGEIEYKKSIKIILKYQDAIAICKNGELEKGYREFQEVQGKSKILSNNAFHYTQLWYLSGMAYYFFRKENYHKALLFTWKEIQETEKLESKGATTLHYRRVGHIGNAIKILNTSGNTDEAVKYALGDLLYTLNGDVSLMPKGNWNRKLFDFLPYNRQRHFDVSFLTIIEMAIEKQNTEKYNESFFYQNIYDKIPDFEVTNNNMAMIYNWLYLQKLYNQKLYKDFIYDSIEFCKVPFDYSFDVLKLSIFSKIIFLLKKSRVNDIYRDKSNLKINDYIQDKLQSKQPLKERVCNLIFE
jgi:hypothetical protein